MSSEKDIKDLHNTTAVVNDLDAKVETQDVADAEELILAETQYDDKQMNKLRWKVDLILMPLLMLTYGLQFADKNALSSGVVFNLVPDTKLIGNQYAMLTLWFYLAYMFFQLPMQWVLQRFQLGKALAVTAIFWGICVIGLGFCQNYTQLTVVRVLLGWMECAVTPGFLLIIASWYKKSEMTLRSLLFMSMNTLFGVVFSIIIYAIAKRAEEHDGVSGWRVINFFLGGLTVFDGFLLLIFLGTPEHVWWLNKEQRKMAKVRVLSNGTGGGEQHPWKWAQIRECLGDPQYYFAVLFNLMATMVNGAVTTFGILIFKSFGFTSLESILYSMPAGAICGTLIITSAVIVTKYPRSRFPLAIVFEILSMITFLYCGLSKSGKWSRWACYNFAGVFTIPSFLTWSIIPMNTGGRTKKSFMSGSVFAAYCIGNMTGSQIFRATDAPRYLKGLTACAIILAVNSVNLAAWWVYYLRANQKKEQAFVASGMSLEERDHENKLAGETDVTDLKNPHFRYTC